MKVLHLSKDNIGGGASIAVFRLHQGLKRAGVKSVMLVMHLAAESHVNRSINVPRKFVQTNVMGARILLENAFRYY